LSLPDSSNYFSSASLGHAILSAVARKHQCFISSSSIAFAPYINRNGVKFVAQQTIVLWLHTTIGVTSADFPFFYPSNIFFIAWKIK
jgi:hypothetical protein